MTSEPPEPGPDENGVEDESDPVERANLQKAMNPRRTPDDIERLRRFAAENSKPPRRLSDLPHWSRKAETVPDPEAEHGDDPTLQDLLHRAAQSPTVHRDRDREAAPVSPQMARSIAATKRAWDAIGDEFGLLTGMEVEALLGAANASRGLVADLNSTGRLLGVHRGDQDLYPGFQFGPDGAPLPIIAKLRTLAAETDCPESDIILWLCGPTGRLSYARPVDLLTSEPERVLQAAVFEFTQEW